MDKELFVQNIKNFCGIRGIKPTIACRESGAGPNLISQLARGTIPSVEQVQFLVQYLMSPPVNCRERQTPKAW